MSKTITYKCDCCGKVRYDSKPLDWISIGSHVEGELCFYNQNTGVGITQLQNYKNLDFCRKYCFVRYFFGSEYAEPLAQSDEK